MRAAVGYTGLKTIAKLLISSSAKSDGHSRLEEVISYKRFQL